MRYDILLTIDYSYQSASDHVRNILRLVPRVGARQTVGSALLTIDPPPDERRDGLDFFGNPTCAVAWRQPVQKISFCLTASAERIAPAPADLSPPLTDLPALIAGACDLGPGAPQHYLGTSPRIVPVPEITEFTRQALPQGDSPRVSVRGAIEAVGRALHDAMTYDPQATDVATPPDQAFAARRGVCQDYAQIMVAGLRALGIPAGYVSGFLRTYPPPGQPRLEGVDAMHAWVMAWTGPVQGWVEYDPTNAQWAGEDYITVAIGRDYADAAPVKGAVRTAGGQETTQAVDVIPLD